MLDEKEKEVQILKKKFEIPSTQLIQTSEWDEFEKEKEALSTELTNYKSKLFNLEEKEKQWEKEAKLLKKSEEDLKARLLAKEKELQENVKRWKFQPLFTM